MADARESLTAKLTAELKAYMDEKEKELSIIKNGAPVSDANRKALYDGMANAESQPAKGPAVTIDSGGISNNKLSNYSFDKQRGDESNKSGVDINKLRKYSLPRPPLKDLAAETQKNKKRTMRQMVNGIGEGILALVPDSIERDIGSLLDNYSSGIQGAIVNGYRKRNAATGDDGKPIMVNGEYYVDRFERPEVKTPPDRQLVRYRKRNAATGDDGKPIMVNGEYYVDRFERPEVKTPPDRQFVIDSLNAYVAQQNDKLETAKEEAGNTGLTFNLKTETQDTNTPPVNVAGTVTADSTPESDAYAFAGIEAQIKDISEMLANANNEEKIYLEEMLERYEAQYERMLALLEQKYGALKDMLTSERSAAEQRAAINFSKLMKYLPEQLRSQGLGGLGTSQSIFLKAYNMYNNQLAAAQNAYLSGMQEGADSFNDSAVALENQYSANTQNARSDYRSAVNANKQFYGSQAANLNNLLLNYKINQESADKLRNENDQNSNYTYAANRLATADFDTVEEVESFINEMRGKMSDAQYELIVKDADRLIEDIKTVKEDEALRLVVSDSIKFNKNAVADWNNDTFTVMMNGDKVKLDAESIVYDTELSKVAKELETNTLFGYDGELYFKNSDGNVVKIAVGKKDYNRVHGELYGK